MRVAGSIFIIIIKATGVTAFLQARNGQAWTKKNDSLSQLMLELAPVIN